MKITSYDYFCVLIMKIREIGSHSELQQQLTASRRLYLLLYKKGSEQSDCAYGHLLGLEVESDGITTLSADVNQVRDIHPVYGVASVPSLLEFVDGQYRNVLKGCLDKSYLKSYFDQVVYEVKSATGDKPARRVTVYTTPTCPWCTTVKNYLRKHGVRYSEVDVAADQSAAQSMVSKSGQQGVPQTEIDGVMVVGFDQSKLNRLLEIKPN
jgi:glutaredoxin-like YruB-family protein